MLTNPFGTAVRKSYVQLPRYQTLAVDREQSDGSNQDFENINGSRIKVEILLEMTELVVERRMNGVLRKTQTCSLTSRTICYV